MAHDHDNPINPTGNPTEGDAPLTGRDRRRFPRTRPTAPVTAAKVVPPLPLTDVEVLDVSTGGISFKTRMPLRPGERMSFRMPQPGGEVTGSRLYAANTAPILAEVLACEPIADGAYRVRCRCLLGAFEAA